MADYVNGENELVKELRIQGYKNSLRKTKLERYRSLSVISAISFAFLGIMATLRGNDLIKTKLLLHVSLILLVSIAIFSLGGYIFLTRKEIDKLTKELESESVKQEQKANNNYYIEILFAFLILSMVIFILSLFTFAYI